MICRWVNITTITEVFFSNIRHCPGVAMAAVRRTVIACVRSTRETARRTRTARDDSFVVRITVGTQGGSGTLRTTAVKRSK